jgi:protein TonB
MQSSTAVDQSAPEGAPMPGRRPGRTRALRVVTPQVNVPKPPRRALDRLAGPAALSLFLLLSLALHAGGGDAALRWASLARPHLTPPPRRIQVAVIEKPRPPPPPVPKVEEPPAPKPKPIPIKKIEVKHVVLPTPVPPPVVQSPVPPTPLVPPPPPIAVAQKPTAAPPVLITGITLQSTTPGGSFAVPVGNTNYGKVNTVAARPEDVKPYKAEHYSPGYTLTDSQKPVFLGHLSADELKKYYPADALKDGLEGQVSLKLTIDSDGTIVRAVVVKDPGHGFGEAARKMMSHELFKPATVNGQAIATEITFVVNWEIPN